MAALAGPGLASLITDEAGVKAPVVENVEVREEEEEEKENIGTGIIAKLVKVGGDSDINARICEPT